MQIHKRIVLHRLLIGFVSLFCVSNQANAQRWTPNPTNPTSGLTLDPVFCYNPNSGMLSIQNAGPNGVVDSTSSQFLGDDYPMVSMLLSFNGTLTSPDINMDGINDPIAVLPAFDNGIAWGAPTVFNNKIQITGSPVSTPGGLAISSALTPILQLDTGLSLIDFQASSGNVEIESGFSFSPTTAGGTAFSTGDASATGAFSICSGDFSDGLPNLSGGSQSVDLFFSTFGSDPMLSAANANAQYPGGVTLFVPDDVAIANAGGTSNVNLGDLLVEDSMNAPNNDSGTPGWKETDLMGFIPNPGDVVELTPFSGNTVSLENGSILYGGAAVTLGDAIQVDNGWAHVLNGVPVPVPEPGSFALAIVSCLLGFVVRRHCRQRFRG